MQLTPTGTSYQSPKFTLANKAYYQLRMLWSAHQFSYVVMDLLRNSALLLRDVYLQKEFIKSQTEQQIEAQLKDPVINSIDAERAHLIIVNQLYTVIPAGLFDADKSALILSKICGNTISEKHEIRFQFINGEQVLIYAMPCTQLSMIQNTLGYEPSIHHGVALMIKDLQNYLPPKEQHQAFFYVRQYSCDVAVFEGKKLLLVNSFSYQNPSEFLYFLIFMLEQCDTDTNTAKVTLMGEIEENSLLYSELYKFVRHLEFIEPIKYHEIEPELMIKPHFYFNLFSRNIENNKR
jgi:hypothetical protein